MDFTLTEEQRAIQDQAIPQLLAGKDLLGIAQTGTLLHNSKFELIRSFLN